MRLVSILALGILGTGSNLYRTPGYAINPDSVAYVILDYKAHAELNNTVVSGADVAVVFKDPYTPVLFLRGADAQALKDTLR